MIYIPNVWPKPYPKWLYFLVRREYKLLIDTLVCCMTSYARERLIIELFRKYEGADENEASLWKKCNKWCDLPTYMAHISLHECNVQLFYSEKNQRWQTISKRQNWRLYPFERCGYACCRLQCKLSFNPLHLVHLFYLLCCVQRAVILGNMASVRGTVVSA